jgi:hypothetical protein
MPLSWSAKAAKVIREVIAQNPELPEPELRKKLAQAYPFGIRSYHPYEAWRKALEDALGPSPKAIAARLKRDAEISHEQATLNLEDNQ